MVTNDQTGLGRRKYGYYNSNLRVCVREDLISTAQSSAIGLSQRWLIAEVPSSSFIWLLLDWSSRQHYEWKETKLELHWEYGWHRVRQCVSSWKWPLRKKEGKIRPKWLRTSAWIIHQSRVLKNMSFAGHGNYRKYLRRLGLYVFLNRPRFEDKRSRDAPNIRVGPHHLLKNDANLRIKLEIVIQKKPELLKTTVISQQRHRRVKLILLMILLYPCGVANLLTFLSLIVEEKCKSILLSNLAPKRICHITVATWRISYIHGPWC